jgi:uncharacterized protein YcbX
MASIHIYPMKSCAPLPLDEAAVQTRGLARDRRWMVVDAHDKFVTGRQQPRLTLIRARPDGDALQLSAPGMPDLRVVAPPADGARVETAVWGAAVRPLLADSAAHDWISSHLRGAFRMVHMDDACVRPVKAKYDGMYGVDGDEVSFADAFPLLLISQAALDALNARLAEPLPILRFRPTWSSPARRRTPRTAGSAFASATSSSTSSSRACAACSRPSISNAAFSIHPANRCARSSSTGAARTA